ncbi:hypothetical protein N7535_001485 [Penicillium sp. DV-2018c]|nr:hypothetical protein N7461_005270 [Penicillium sp. DV-2018c]KAJ5582865.1 hypothetical protein N7535_001485 [Penicillium sp. DV-2018c]
MFRFLRRSSIDQAPQAVPQAAPQASPQAAPQAAPQETPQEAPRAARRNHDLSPWKSKSKRLMEPADKETLWLTVELKEHTKLLNDDHRLLQYVIRNIRESNAVLDTRAQHYIRPMCLSIPCSMLPNPFETTNSNPDEVCRNEAVGRVYSLIEKLRAGRLRIDRAVLFGPR